MSDDRSGNGGYLVTFATFIVAIALSEIPLHPSLQWFRPDWPLLVLLFWVLWAPNRVGLITAFLVGLLLDLIRGGLLGQTALTLTILTFVAQLLYQRVRVFPLLQQSIVVGLLVSLNQLFYFGMQGLFGNTGDSLMFLVPALTSAIVWPLHFMLMRKLARALDLN
ncbi:rod shape-determining protein MreD [Marinobacterium sp. LSUCC0821]|jgi:rod shape-determining protein MreD|uniref:rod shape-determining protein MreD n=1 Tax=Marinobacterium sp. LSUCC0821 TaxID=2668067 RepID=UPI001451104F|nr:rod shape-determining protein MreD [Marinobacterium sp. LSUCC0821]QJD70387.1 rod shape-determining protein MreD [Marinobacterium sp. LSUCC0821]